jgi:hypothetical protein
LKKRTAILSRSLVLHAITLSCLYVSRQNWELEDGFSRQNEEAAAGDDHQLPHAEALTVPAQDERGKRDTDIRWRVGLKLLLFFN